MNFAGLKIITQREPFEDRVQWRFPRSKKKRIRRKWAKKPGNWRISVRYDAWRMGDTVVMHPEALKYLKQQVDKLNDALTVQPPGIVKNYSF